MNRVCRECNSFLGSRVDAAISDNFLCRHRRSVLGIAGNSGTAPLIFCDFLEGEHRLSSDPDQKVRVRYNPRTQKLDLKAIPRSSIENLANDRYQIKIIIDSSEVDQIPKHIRRLCKREGLGELSDAQVASIMRDIALSPQEIAKPQVTIEKSYDFSFVRHAMIKIAYELAFLWLGESYLDDPDAAALREAILSADPTSTSQLPAYVQDAQSLETLFSPFLLNQNCHYAFELSNDEGLAIGVRVFDLFAGFVWVTKDVHNYLSNSAGQHELRFVEQNPITRTVRESTVMQEILRMIVTRREVYRAAKEQAGDGGASS